jgi:hypothetical protein
MSSGWTIKEVQDGLEEQKKEKHFLDKSAIVKNTAPGRSADSAAMLEHFLPSKEEEFKNAEKLTTVFDTSSRAGAGGTKAGVVGIRPNGGKAASEFLEMYTGIGRFKPQAVPFTEKINICDKGNDNARKPSVVFYKSCMDCMKPLNRDDCVPNMNIIPPLQIATQAEIEKWRSVGLKPGMVVCYCFCTPCIKEAVAIQKDPYKQMPLIVGGVETTLAKMEMQKRASRISDQVIAEIKRERENPETDVFYGDAKLD